MAASVLFSGLPHEFAEFYDYVRGLKYDEDPDYDRWQGIFDHVLTPYVDPDESFELASAREYEEMDYDLVDRQKNWPRFSIYNPLHDDDKEEHESCPGRIPTHFVPYSSWPDPAGVKEEDLFGDEDQMLKGSRYYIHAALHSRRWRC